MLVSSVQTFDVGTDREVICEFRTRWYATLSNANNSVHFICPIHEDAMKMEGSGLVSELIIYIDNDSITNSCFDPWNRPLSIDANDRALPQAVWIPSDPADLEVISARCCESLCCKENYRYCIQEI